MNLFFAFLVVGVVSACRNITPDEHSSILCCENGTFAQVHGKTVAFSEFMPEVCCESEEPFPQLELQPLASTGSALLCLVLAVVVTCCCFFTYKCCVARLRRQSVKLQMAAPPPSVEVAETSV